MIPQRRPLKCAIAVLRGAAVLGLLAHPASRAGVRFRASEIRGKSSEILFCDLNGDCLKDTVLIDEQNLVLFYQDPKGGFGKEPDLVYDLGDTPAVVWPAKLGSDAESLLVMTSRGATELSFVQRRYLPTRERIIAQPTLIPERLEGPSVRYFRLSVETKGHGPSILVPEGNDLHLWQRRDTWQHVQSLEQVVDTTIWAFDEGPGYNKAAQLDMSVGDVNGDRRDDLMIRKLKGPTETYALYAQKEDRLFTTDPVLTWAHQWDWSWSCWVDVNQDGNVDLIRNTWLYEPWFLPGTRSGKVLVRVYVAGEEGRIPAEPQQVFRKNDWIDSVPIVDVDGDGLTDLVLGYSRFDSREGFRKALTAKQLDFDLRFHFCRPSGAFPRRADCERRLLIHLDRHSTNLTWGRRRHMERFVNLSGDFDGDGDVDLLIRDRGEQVSVYPFLSRRAGFARKAIMSFDYTEPAESFVTADLNADGISDLIMKLRKRHAYRVFVSRGMAR